MTDDSNRADSTIPGSLTVLPLRDIVVYPYMIFPVLIGRSSSLKAVSEALERGKYIFLVAQHNAQVEDPSFNDIYSKGTVARILQILRLPNNLLKVLVEGVMQGCVTSPVRSEPYMEANIDLIPIISSNETKGIDAMVRHASELFEQYVRTNRNLPPEVLGAFENIDDPVRKMYYAAANVQQKVENKQRILETTKLEDQYFELISLLSSELEMLKLEAEIDTKVQDTIQKSQRKYFIQEQIRALQKELGDDDDGGPELSGLKESLDMAGMPEETFLKVMEEFERLKKTPPMSPEFSVNRTWLEWVASVPWSKTTDDNLDVSHVKTILDEDHYDLDKPKERILEYISVLNLVGSIRGQILCFVGPPGVGKTSLAKSIARATGRSFVRISLGGVRDEAEIRGHRRTYIGAMPGKIIQAMKRAGSVNPVILLDEIDKMSMDFRGDPSSAMLEVLDPEQNVAFSDHYIELDYDLSKVLFVATANVRYDIPAPLLDRMEVISLSSYLEPDKVEIAKRHILPKLLMEHGLSEFPISFTEGTLTKMIREYTRESGVRNLEREIASVLRKVATEIVTTVSEKTGAKSPAEVTSSKPFKAMKRKKIVVDEKRLEQYLKAPRFKSSERDFTNTVGVATGLAWTSHGGDIMPVEVTIMPGAEKLTLTGKLGDVMKESAVAALSYVRSNHALFGLDEGFAKSKEIHIHVPEGAIPKDGPSAGITMTCALLSAATGEPLRADVAMTGEVTLRGKVLAIGGLNEKLLAAKRVGISTVVVPFANKRDVEDLSPIITTDLNLVYAENVIDILPTVFSADSRLAAIKLPEQNGKRSSVQKRGKSQQSTAAWS